MSVMESIRRSTDSTAMRLIFGAIVLVFIFWGIGGEGGTGVVVAEVGTVMITDSEMNRAVRIAARGESLDDKGVKELSGRVLESLIVEELLRQEARDLGLEVSDEEVAREMLRQPGFQDKDGKFSEAQMESALRSSGIKRGQFEEQSRDELLRRKLQNIVVSGVVVSDQEVETMIAQQLTGMSAKWVLLSDAALMGSVPVSPEELQRKLADEEKLVREQYDRELNSRWTREKKARIAKISLRRDLAEGGLSDVELRQKADAILAEAKAGADFAALARKYSEDLSAVNGGQLGAMSEVQLGPVAGPAVTLAGANSLTPVLEVAGAFEIFQVMEVTEAEVTTWELARDTIAREQLQQEKLAAHADSAAARVLDGWKASGAPPAELLAELRVEAVSSGPFPPSQPRLPGAGSSEALNLALSKMTAPGLLPTIYQATNGRLIVEVTEIDKPDPESLKMFAEMGRAQLERERQEEAVDRWLKDLRNRHRVVQHYKP